MRRLDGLPPDRFTGEGARLKKEAGLRIHGERALEKLLAGRHLQELVRECGIEAKHLEPAMIEAYRAREGW